MSRPSRNLGGGRPKSGASAPKSPPGKPQRPKSRWGEGGTGPAPFIAPSPGGRVCPHRSQTGGGPEPLFTAPQVRVWGVPFEPPKSQVWGSFVLLRAPSMYFKFSSEPPDPFREFLKSGGSPGGIFGLFRGSLSLLWGSSGSRCSVQALRSSGSATSKPLPPPAGAARCSRKGFRGSRRGSGGSRGVPKARPGGSRLTDGRKWSRVRAEAAPGRCAAPVGPETPPSTPNSSTGPLRRRLGGSFPSPERSRGRLRGL